MFESALGGWGNKEVGAYCHTSEEWTRYETEETADLLSASEEREFVVRWFDYGGQFLVEIYKAGELHPFIEHAFDCVPVNFGYIGYASAWGVAGEWQFCFGKLSHSK